MIQLIMKVTNMIYGTRRCPVCLKTGFVDVKEDELFTYLRGEYVQTAFTSLTIPLREQIISGVHPECWQEMWGQERENQYVNEYDAD
jgi:hypothetical protein